MADDEQVRVRARDGEEVAWSRKAARHAGILKHLMDDVPSDSGVYPAPTVSAEVLGELGAMCEPEYTPPASLGMRPIEELFTLIEGAIYLDAQAALEHVQLAIVSHLAGKRTDELRVLLGAEDDFESESERKAALTESVFMQGTSALADASGSAGPVALQPQPSLGALLVTDDAKEAAVGLANVFTLVELKGVNRSWCALARRVLDSRICRHEGQPAPMSEVTDLNIKMLHDAGRPWEAAWAGRLLLGLERLHWDGWEVNVAAVRNVDLDEVDEDEDEDQDPEALLSRAATTALQTCITGEGEPPPQLLLAAIVCAGSGEIRGIPVEQMRDDSLAELDLKFCSIGDEGAKLLACLIPSMGTSLTSLDLRHNELGPTGAAAIAPGLAASASLTSLNLHWNSLEDEGITAICEALQSNDGSKLISLTISSNGVGLLGAKSVVAMMAVRASLTVTDMRFNNLDTESATMLVAIAKENGISLCGIKPGQTEADLSGEPGCRMVPTDAILLTADIFVRAELTKIWLGYNSLGDEGTRTLCNALSESKVSKLQELDLSRNDIGPPSTKALSEMLLVCAELTSVWSPGYNSGPASHLFLHLTIHTHVDAHVQLNLSNNRLCGVWDDYDGRGLKGTYTVEGIYALADALRVTADLTSLNVCNNNITGDGRSDNNGAQELARVVLSKQNLESFCDIPLKELRADSLTELNLHGKGVGVPGALVLAELLRTVTASLTSLNVRYNSIEGDGASQLSAAVLVNTKIEVFNGIPIKQMRANSFTELHLRGKDMGVVGGMVVAGLLPAMASLTSFNVSYNNITGDGAQELARVVLSKQNLESFCEIPLKELRADSLKELNLSEKGVGVPGALVLAEMLRTFTTELMCCNVLRNEMDVEAANLLVETVKDKDISLCGLKSDQKEANFSYQELEPPDAILLASDLSKAGVTGSLTKLDVSYNTLDRGGQGVKMLRDAVRGRQDFTLLDNGNG